MGTTITSVDLTELLKVVGIGEGIEVRTDRK